MDPRSRGYRQGVEAGSALHASLLGRSPPMVVQVCYSRAVRFGAHVSVRGRLPKAVARAVAIGCECLQIFVGNPRQWRPVSYPPADLEEFRRARAACRLDPLVAHTPYLVNLAATGEVYERSVRALGHALEVVEALEGLGVVTHIGSARDCGFAEAVRRVARAVRRGLAATDHALVLLEGSAGNTLGGTFRELEALVDALDGDRRVGICLDTAHLHATGWDLRTPEGVEAMLGAFHAQVGLERLRLVHLNDTRVPCGSRRDSHENIGAGRIGLAGFRALVNHPWLDSLCGIIETPGFGEQGPDRRNLEVLKSLRAKAVGEAGR
ncbi:MAG: deoxyribonuclease IV [Armatimonadota bacterium]|nr:deoxyribonuclease IV [Armatimonadota bacterium]MDR7439271.1 deoxyribonuclease IV [Armatimonadota bacterium]MDR7562048.1 deoxyribonuclease IV [Armatimonadota bacterium]MDR7567282.1 deoxyribonuclease IV [Armatimonadota bacterium]MDR7601125.1 deoxyribonuclease IV [Armatimonadota bacterium]